MKQVFKNVFSFANDFLYQININNINAHAAACAFYMFLSLVPFIGLVTSVIPYTGLTQETLLYSINHYIPEAMQSLIASIIDDIYFAHGFILPVTIVLTVYLASRAFSALIRGIEVISGTTDFLSFFKRTLLACVYTVALVAAMLFVLAVLVFGRHLVWLITEKFPMVSPAVKLLVKCRLAVVVLLLTAIFVLIYHGVPGMKLGMFKLLPGAAAAAGSWLLFTWLFSLFILYGDGYSTYGSLAAIIISLLWMYWCMYIILLGAQLDMFINNSKSGQ